MTQVNTDYPGVIGPSVAVNGNVAVFDGTTGKLIKDGGMAAGNVVGPASSTDVGIAGFNGTTGKIIQEIGIPASPIFSAADYAATGAATWTVGSGNVNTSRYSLQGKFLAIWLQIVNSSIGGTLANEYLTFKLPLSKVCSKNNQVTALAVNNGGSLEVIKAETVSGASVIRFRRLTSDWQASAGNANLDCYINVEVQ